jgi:hypothetical protein
MSEKKKKASIITLFIFFMLMLLSACLDNSENIIDTENMSDNAEHYIKPDTTEINTSYPCALLRYNDNVYGYYDEISNCGEEWVIEYTGFIYLDEAKYVDEVGKLSEDLTTNYYGGDLVMYQCNEDCSVIAGCSEDGQVVLFVAGNVFHSDECDDVIKNIWRYKNK